MTEPPLDLPAQHTYSASQVETFLLCRRKWAFTKIAKLRYPDKPSAALGTAVHSQLEGYLQGEPLDFARPDEAGYIAAAGVHLLPEPGAPGMHIEKGFDFSSTRTRFRWLGRKDLQVDDTCIFPADPENPDAELGGVPGVSDHKSTSGIGWAKKPEDLEFDVQANLYGYDLLSSSASDAGDLIWTYYQTKGGKKAKRTHLRVLRPHVERMFGLIEDVALEMAELEKAGPWVPPGDPALAEYVNTITANPSACTAFGGCEHQHVCELTLKERMRSIMPGISLLDSLKKRAAEQTTETPANPSPVNPPKTEPIAVTPPPVVVADQVTETKVEDVEATKTKRTTRAKKEEPATSSDGYTLYVNCLQTKGRGGLEAATNTALLVEAARPIIQANSKSDDAPDGLPDYRFAPFGQGPGMLVVAVRTIVESPEFTAIRKVFVDTRTPEGLLLLNLLAANAAEIVQAA